ncbi:MAG: hypothetical protein IJD35_06450 [Clostridia bacterium]|nr:hypothetical protein [Clostridia bacterium]
MIVCKNCGRKFRDKFGLVLCVITDNGDDTVTAERYDGGDVDETKSKVVSGCPNCLTDAFLIDKPSRYKRKYRKGGHILSLDELVKQDFVYWHDKIHPRGWFLSWQFRMAADNIGENGCIFYAIKEE